MLIAVSLQSAPLRKGAGVIGKKITQKHLVGSEIIFNFAPAKAKSSLNNIISQKPSWTRESLA